MIHETTGQEARYSLQLKYKSPILDLLFDLTQASKALDISTLFSPS